jgi:outer membrane protein with beta-barrel domain
MKKNLSFFISFILLINYVNAQKTQIGLTAGATLASYKARLESVSVTSKTKVGFTAGLTISSPIGKKFAFRPSLNFVQKGGKQTDEGYSEKTTFNYIELPLNFVYNAGTSKGMFFIGAGPSLGIGLSGKDKWHDGTESGSDDIKFGSGDDTDLKSFEAGINVLAGYQFKGGFFVTANYNAGVNNVAPDDPDFDTKYHNRYFGISIGYMFSSKAK